MTSQRLIILTDIEIINTNFNNIIGYPIEYQEWQQQVQQYETIQKNHQSQSNSKPFYFDDNEPTGALPPVEEMVPRAVIMENNSMSFQESEVSRQQDFQRNKIPRQDSNVSIDNVDRFMFHAKPKPASVDKDKENKSFARNNGNSISQPQVNTLSPENNKNKIELEQNRNVSLQQSLTTATETDSGKYFSLINILIMNE